jgi:hypothetical protein
MMPFMMCTCVHSPLLGPENRLHVEFGEQDFGDLARMAAAEAGAATHLAGNSSEAILSTMEGAEEAYEAGHGGGGGGAGRPLAGAMPPAAGADTVASPRLRHRVVQRLEKAMKGNSVLGGTIGEAQAAAQACEAALFDAARSSGVYESLAGNATRVAASSRVESVQELVRVAMGRPRGGTRGMCDLLTERAIRMARD